jgi:integrase
MLTQALERFLQAQDFTANTIILHRTAIKYFLRIYDDVDPKVVTVKMADKYKESLRTGLKGNTTKPSSRNTMLACISSFWDWLIVWEYAERNPFSAKRLQRYAEGKVIRPIFTEEEIQRIFNAIGDDLCMQLAFSLALCGCRRGEFLNLIVDDVVFGDKTEIKLSAKYDSRTTWHWGIKNKKEQHIPVPPGLEELLTRRINQLEPPQPYITLPKVHYERNIKRMKEGTITQCDRDCPWQGFNRDFGKILKKAGVKHKVPHAARKTLCMKLFAQHEPLPVVQQVMRHASINTTVKHYANFDQRKAAQSAEKHIKLYVPT